MKPSCVAHLSIFDNNWDPFPFLSYDYSYFVGRNPKTRRRVLYSPALSLVNFSHV